MIPTPLKIRLSLRVRPFCFMASSLCPYDLGDSNLRLKGYLVKSERLLIYLQGGKETLFILILFTTNYFTL